MCTLIVTSVSRSSYVLPLYGAVLGWRVMFGIVGVLSMLVSYLVYRDLQDPLREKEDTPKMSWALVKEEWSILRKLLRNNTFVIIVLQGVFSGIPWNALSFMVMYFQFCGLSDPQAGLLVSLFVLACAVGGPLGGYIGDRAAQRYPDNGRAWAAQFSSLSGVPCMCFLLLLISQEAGPIFIY
jgi:MFS family permease